jgi:hypothetical protein
MELLLEYNNVYPEIPPKDVLEYLKGVSRETLLNTIGFFNIQSELNYDNFFSNPSIHWDVINRVNLFKSSNNLDEEPAVLTRQGSLRLAEIILSNMDILAKEKIKSNIDLEERNIFISILLINSEINSKYKPSTSEENIEQLADFYIKTIFPVADIEVFKNNDYLFIKGVWCTIVRFEMIVEFLKSDKEYAYLIYDLTAYFNSENIDELAKNVKTLFFHLINLKQKKSFKFEVEDRNSLNFLKSLTSKEIEPEEDFINLRNYPIYCVSENEFSVIDYFFVLDKFNKSLKFLLKNSFNTHNNLSAKSGNFFNFFNTKFSENYLMNNVLNSIYSKRHHRKKKNISNGQNEPDYYVRHNNRIYLFENKDVLIAKDIKSSGDIDKINSALRTKFFKSDGHSVGIGQLVNSIVSIVEKTFDYDDYVNTKQNLTIYPVLVMNDRIFEIPALNYRLNTWYLSLVKEKLRDKYNSNYIKNLSLIDIDTLIFWEPYLKHNPKKFHDLITLHHRKMNENKKIKISDYSQAMKISEQNILSKFKPLSHRFPEYQLDIELIKSKFTSLVSP